MREAQAEEMRRRGLITAQAVADAVGLTRDAVAKWIRDGKVKRVKVGSATYVDAESVLRHVGADAAKRLDLRRRLLGRLA